MGNLASFDFFFFFLKPTGLVQIWCMQEHLKPVSPQGCDSVWCNSGGTDGLGFGVAQVQVGQMSPTEQQSG